METLALLEWAGCLFGLLGSVMLACNKEWSGYGFLAYLASNVCWAIFGIMTGSIAMLVMQAGFTVVSIFGIRNWILKPEPAVS